MTIITTMTNMIHINTIDPTIMPIIIEETDDIVIIDEFLDVAKVEFPNEVELIIVVAIVVVEVGDKIVVAVVVVVGDDDDGEVISDKSTLNEHRNAPFASENTFRVKPTGNNEPLGKPEICCELLHAL